MEVEEISPVSQHPFLGEFPAYPFWQPVLWILMYPTNLHNRKGQFFPQYLSVHLSICLSIYARLSGGFWMYPANLTIMEAIFFSLFIFKIVHLFICLYPSTLLQPFSLLHHWLIYWAPEVRGTIKVHTKSGDMSAGFSSCALQMPFPPSSLPDLGTPVSVACISEAPSASLLCIRVHPVLLAAD